MKRVSARFIFYKKNMAKLVKILALLPLFPFGFPNREGQELEVEKKQADELIAAGYAQLVVVKVESKTISEK